MNLVRVCLDSTGVVSGELGFANAWRERQRSLNEWLTDERSVVREFAKRHISDLEQMIVAEQRRAESGREMRNHEYDDDKDEEPTDNEDGEGA